MQRFLWNLWRRNILPFLRDSFIHHCRYAISHSAMFLNNTVLKFALLLCSHLRLGLPLRFFHCRFSTSFIWILLLPHSFHILFPSYFPLLDHPNIATRREQIMNSRQHNFLHGLLFPSICSKCSSWPSLSKALNKIINAVTTHRPT